MGTDQYNNNVMIGVYILCNVYTSREYVIRNVIVQAASARPITVSCPHKRAHVHNYNIIH